MSSLISAIRARRERAVAVAADYVILFAGMQAWVVRHPDEPDRCYLVDMIERTCSCPDNSCFRIDAERIDCKHILAVAPLWEKLTGRLFSNRATVIPPPRIIDADRDEFGNPIDPFEPI